MILFKALLCSLSLMTIPSGWASTLEMDRALAALTGSYIRAGGSPKALQQLRCFLKTHGSSDFSPKQAGGGMQERCNARREISLSREHFVAIVDYTKTSDRPRFFIFDLKNRQLKTLFVAHGKYGDTDRLNTRVMYNPKRNSVLKAVHFSNTVGSNAPTSGFYLTGPQYSGQWGPSLVLHGLEKSWNDNSCERATVIHSSVSVTETGVTAMSSGCPMVATNKLDFVLKNLAEGTALYIYSPNEARLSEKFCGREFSKN